MKYNTCIQSSSSSSFRNESNTARDIKKRSSKACDNCRKSKCKCTRTPDPDGEIPSTKPCQNCITNGLVCTFNGTSRKRGPPKGYIEAIESRLHRMEAFLSVLLESDDPRAQALFSELGGDNAMMELLQNDLKSTAQSSSSIKSRRSCKLPGSNSQSLDDKAKLELTDTQMALWGVNVNQFAASREHRSQEANNFGVHSSDQDDDSEYDNDLPDHSPVLIPDKRYHHHRTRRRRLDSNLSHRCKLPIATFKQPPSNTTLSHTTNATFTLTQEESCGPSTRQHVSPLSDNSALQTPQPGAYPNKQQSPATVSELADVVGQLSLDENDEVRYHGRSSGLYLISASQRYQNFFWNFPKPGIWPVAPIRRSHSTLDIFELVNPLEVLPSREIMDHLLDFYWAFVHPMMPVLYKAEFLTHFQNLMNNLDKVKQVRPHWTINQVWCHALSSNNASSNDSSHQHSPSHPLEQLETRINDMEPTNQISVLLLLVMFAISSRYSNQASSPPVEGQYWNAGDKYLSKAKQMLNLDYGNSKLTNCQSLILMAYREIGSGAMGESWLYTGMAIRMAQDMGLFRDVDKWFMPVKRFTHEEKQIRKRVWWACVNMDKYVSTYIGRPMMIFERDYDTAFPSADAPDEHEPWKGWSPNGETIELLRPVNQKHDSTMTQAPEDDGVLSEDKKDPAISDRQSPANVSSAISDQEKSYTISCFSRSASLSVLISRIVANIYAVRIRVIGQSNETLLSLLDQNLARWYLDLPEHLQYNPQHIPQTSNISSFAGLGCSKGAITPHLLTLHAQFYTALILLHRPFIPVSHPQVNPSSCPVDSPSCSPSLDICTTAANAITSIAQTYGQLFGLRQAPVFLVYYIFTAAILHVYNASSDAGLALTAKANLLKCMNSLKEMAPTWTGAVRAWELLVGLVDLRDHNESGNQQQQSSSSHPTASNLVSQALQKLNPSEERRLKRPASSSGTEDQMKHYLSHLMNPQASSSKSATGNSKSIQRTFDPSRLNFDWTANQETPQTRPVKLVRPLSHMGWSTSADGNVMKQMNIISDNTPACQRDSPLPQSMSSGTESKLTNEPGLSMCNRKDLTGFRIDNSKFLATPGNTRVISSRKEDGNLVGLNYRPDCQFPQGETFRQYSSVQAILPTTALEEMMVMNPSGPPYGYNHQPSLQSPAPPPSHQPLREHQQYQSNMNQGLSPPMFDFNNFTSSSTRDHHSYGPLNDPEVLATSIQGIFGLGGPAPQQLGKFTEDGLINSEQNHGTHNNLHGQGEEIETEREQLYTQERMRPESSMTLKDDIPLEEIFSDACLKWLPSSVDPVVTYNTNPSRRNPANSRSHPPPQTTNPHDPSHPTHALHK